MQELPDTNEELKARFNTETSKLNWQELQRFYASGAIVAVAEGLDLIEVACQFSRDNKQAVEAWLAAGKIFKVDEEHALQWSQQDLLYWTVVVAPWVLVQVVSSQ